MIGGVKVLRHMVNPAQGGTALVRSSGMAGSALGCGGIMGVGLQCADPSAVMQDQQVRWANLKTIRNRMRSVGSIGKITKAMKMVAAAKLKGVQRVQQNAKPFAKGFEELFKLMDDVKVDTANENPSELVIAFTSDRGLCGGVNSAVVKNVKNFVAHKGAHAGLRLLLVGDKGRDGLSRTCGKLIDSSFKDVFRGPVSFEQACVIAEEIMKNKYDKITMIYNQFKSVISQEVVNGVVPGLEFMKAHAEVFDEYEFDTDLESADALVDLFEFKLASQIYSACLENGTSEQAARMSAMDNATRNAGDMLSRLTLTYNRQRQAVITSELIEIISGAEALVK